RSGGRGAGRARARRRRAFRRESERRPPARRAGAADTRGRAYRIAGIPAQPSRREQRARLDLPRLVRRLAQRTREPGALLSLVRPSTRILLLRQPLELALQLAPALEPLHVERAVGQRAAHPPARPA